MQSKAQIDQMLRQKSDAKEIPGVVAVAADSNEVIFQGAYGKRDLAKDDAMTVDSVFWIASMTKAITTAAGMQLVEQGKLSLDAPIGKVLPDLANPQVLEVSIRTASRNCGPRKTRSRYAISWPYRRLLLPFVERRHGQLPREVAAAGDHHLQERCVESAADLRSRHALGIRHQYRFVGKAVEAASGTRLDAYLRDNLFTPAWTTPASRSARRSASAWSGCMPTARTDR
jgi:methyl acetate hydrolase